MRKITLIILCIFFIPSSVSQAASPEVIRSLTVKLDSWDVEEAWSEIKDHLLRDPNDPQLLELASHIAFHRGQYREALKWMKSAIEVGGEEEKRTVLALFVEQTIGVVTPFKEFESPHFMILLDEKQDGFLSDYIINALE